MRKKIFLIVFITSFFFVFSTLGLFFSWNLEKEKAYPIFLLSLWGFLNGIISFVFYFFKFYNLFFVNKMIELSYVEKNKNKVFIILLSIFITLLIFLSASILYITLPIVYTGNQISNIEYIVEIIISLFVIFFQFSIIKKLFQNYIKNSRKAYKHEKANS